MGNGLFLTLKEFNKLPNSAKLSCLYENQLKTFEVLEIQKKMYEGIKLHQKIQYGVMTLLSGGFIFLIKFAVTN